jgi:hypothetical protein
MLLSKKMAPDRAPGPDVFNGFCMKKCWYIICEDFYRLCAGFENYRVDLESINGSFITLVPKKDCLLTVNEAYFSTQFLFEASKKTLGKPSTEGHL